MSTYDLTLYMFIGNIALMVMCILHITITKRYNFVNWLLGSIVGIIVCGAGLLIMNGFVIST